MAEQESLALFDDTTEELFMKGTMLSTIFYNAENLFSVVRILVKETNADWDEKDIIVTGFFPALHEQEVYTFYGKMQEHAKFGQQFKADRFRKEMPQSRAGLINYLSGELFKGIGKVTAENIVDTIGDDAITKILSDPSLLNTVPKLPSGAAESLLASLRENQGLEHVMVGLNEYGFGPQLSMKIFQAYKQNAIEVLENNPYKLIEDVKGIGFQRADELGRKLGLGGNHPERLRAGILFMLDSVCMQQGHVYMEQEVLLGEVTYLLEESEGIRIDQSILVAQVEKLVEEQKIITENTRVYMPSLYYSESGFAHHVKRMLKQTEYQEQFPQSEFLLALGELEERIGVHYGDSQRQALEQALMSPMLVLTGGPGTGKTTVIKGIVELYAELNGVSLDPHAYKDGATFPVLLAAPTGRAAKRMSESTGLPAMTIHRLLGMNGQEQMDDDAERLIDGRLLIVDEMSMVDIWLANQLFRALPAHMQVVLVGDQDQLPSVGPGQVLKDILQSEQIPTVALSDIYRQKDGSSIIEMAHYIKEGMLPADFTKNSADRSFFHCTVNQIGDVVEQVVKNAKNKGFRAKDIQVLAPMYRGPAGIDILNKKLQEIFNPNDTGRRKEVQFGEIKYRVHDKVLQLINQPEKNVFNGDIGEIVSIIYAKENTEKQDLIVVQFDQTEVSYYRQEFNQLTHAYCCSIHKAQGSEFPIVIMPIVRSYYRMLRRDLLYTGVTRSKQFLILCGEEEAFRMGIERIDENKRNTTLSERLMSEDVLLEQMTNKRILTAENITEIDPMIGMEGITPEQFMVG
ncbi:ATP-dependent RecD-like DNA helicase [Listeria monocytogenes]|nr:ATP-dependent RecD-like DNA helicase [Listeria monocytogenes]EAK9248928.1 ATP-dependent RecD-like DNA helicase [Listeria monocytogenes]ECH3806834.1 ATP-dependent RecD-like DNA helicase [Listeria monocytogenes]ECO7678988.1 ATP-dependent RecD-like DNA helicase [Listeria monocytogenes]ECR5203535.1 ATP-dependent RecD-like DNA helicase [Listeria monocytogenes]